MYERWKKLTKDFYNHRKDKYGDVCPRIESGAGRILAQKLVHLFDTRERSGST